ncbi:MAG: hypothetical protein ACKPEY_04795, partial [Planctomycetota bacterium]
WLNGQLLSSISESTALYRHALDQDKTHIKSRVYLADALQGMGDLDGAREAMQPLMPLQPQLFHSEPLIGHLLIETEDPLAAINEMKRLVSIDRANPELHCFYLMALAYQKEWDQIDSAQ